MQNNLKVHAEQKELILKNYEKILKNEMLLSYDIKKEDIQERVKNLEKERFILSICGQMNSGKSTLLNSYIFGDLILPYSATTQTAKLTIINYSDKPYFEPVFYTQNEWDQVKKYYKGNKEFEESLELAEKAKININDILEKKKSEKINDIKMLFKYVAMPEHGGVYSPFINYVNLFYPDVKLKEVTIVDTPGINDPNKLRENITLEWVKKSDAVLYVTWALGAFTEDDFSFIDKNLLHIPKDNIVIAVNKSDIPDDTESIDKWLNGLFDDEKFRHRDTLNKSTLRVFVCSLGELIRKMNEKKIELNKDLKFHFDRYSKSKDYTKKEYNNIDILGKAIEEKLIKNKGAKLLDSHNEFIKSLFTRIKDVINLKLESNKNGQSDYEKDNEQLQLDIDNLEKQKQKIEKEYKELDFKKRKLITDLSNKQDISARTLKEDIVSEIRKEISNIDNIKLFYDQVPWILKKTFDNNIDILANTFKELTIAYNKEVENEIESFVNVLSRYQLFSRDFVRSSFNLSTFEIREKFTENINKNLTRSHIETMIEGITSGWARFFNLEIGRRQSVEFLTNKTDEIIGNEITSVQKQARDEIRESVNKVFDELNSMANVLINERVDSKKKAMKKKTDKERELQELKEEEQKLIQTKNDIILSEKEINQ